MRRYFQILPEKLLSNLPAVEQIIRPLITGYCSDNLKEVVSIVSCHVRKDEGATPLSVVYINKLVPQGDKYLRALIKAGVIERTGPFIPGQLCYQYDFTANYDGKYISLPLNNAKLIRRIETAQEALRKEAAKSVRGHSEQVKYLRQLTIEPGFMDFMQTNYTADTEAFNRVLASATRILNGDIFYSIDTTSGRFHSNVTNSPKGFRPYLRIYNEPLCNIDIKNSQPYLSTIILTNPGKVSYLTENTAFALLLQTLKVTLTEDVKKYIYLVANGQLYEYLMTEFAREGLHLNRAETKVQVLRILFARNRKPKDETNRKAREIFTARFPKVHRIFSKVRGHASGDKFTNYKRFAILLQRIESYLMLDIVMKRIYKELPGTIAVTVHDSIMTGILTNNVEAVRKILVEELTTFVGFRPNVSIEGIIESKEEEEGIETISKQYVSTTFVSSN